MPASVSLVNRGSIHFSALDGTITKWRQVTFGSPLDSASPALEGVDSLPERRPRLGVAHQRDGRGGTEKGPSDRASHPHISFRACSPQHIQEIARP